MAAVSMGFVVQVDSIQFCINNATAITLSTNGVMWWVKPQYYYTPPTQESQDKIKYIPCFSFWLRYCPRFPSRQDIQDVSFGTPNGRICLDEKRNFGIHFVPCNIPQQFWRLQKPFYC